MGICPDTAVKRCGLGALIMAAYQITNDRRQAHDLAIKAHAAAARKRHTRQRQRREGSCCGAGAVR